MDRTTRFQDEGAPREDELWEIWGASAGWWWWAFFSSVVDQEGARRGRR